MSTRIPSSYPKIHGGAQWPGAAAGLPPLARVGSRELGEVVTNHRSSWVRRLPSDAGSFFVKTYDFESWRSRVAAIWRRPLSWWRSRAAREFLALQWLRTHGFGAPEPIATLHWRCAGLLRRAVLVTRECAGQPLDQLLRDPSTDHEGLAQAAGAFVARLHRAGFRDRNLDLRNLLARHDGTAWCLAKLDSPRFVLRRGKTSSDALARADWRRLLRQLDPNLATVAARAAAEEWRDQESRQRSRSTPD